MLAANIILGAMIGAALGSFVSATAWRLPRNISLKTPSRCDSCNQPIRPWRNIPVVSWVSQKGQTACCQAKIPASVLMVELIGALVGALIGGLAGAAGMAALAFVTLLLAGIGHLYYRNKSRQSS